MTARRSDERYVGIPYKELGRAWTGIDCWGLVKLFLEQEAGVTGLPTDDYEDLQRIAKRFRAGITSDPDWVIQRGPAQRFDCWVMTTLVEGERPLRYPGHIGVMVSPTHLLHVWEKSGASVVVPISHQMFRNRLLERVRHIQLCSH